MPSTEETRLVNPQLLLLLSASWCLVLHSPGDAVHPSRRQSQELNGLTLARGVIALLVHIQRVSLSQGTN